MRAQNQMLDYGGTKVGSAYETTLLGRIGSELALVYHDTLQSPLPPSLQAILDRLDRDGQRDAERPSREEG